MFVSEINVQPACSLPLGAWPPRLPWGSAEAPWVQSHARGGVAMTGLSVRCPHAGEAAVSQVHGCASTRPWMNTWLSLWVHFPHGLYLICWAIWVNCNVKKKKAYWTTVLLLWRKLSFFSVYHWYSWVLLLYPYNVRINIKVLSLVWWRNDFRKRKCWKASRQNKIINIPTPNHSEQ